jgi:predicted nucleotidyltransferase
MTAAAGAGSDLAFWESLPDRAETPQDIRAARVEAPLRARRYAS